ncbi:MAG: hypothetical protein V7606_3526 [Burkholderiales bacterium]
MRSRFGILDLSPDLTFGTGFRIGLLARPCSC